MASGSYRPQSPDLSGLPYPQQHQQQQQQHQQQQHQQQQSFTGYRPQSPDLSSLTARGTVNAPQDFRPHQQQFIGAADYHKQPPQLLPNYHTSNPYAHPPIQPHAPAYSYQTPQYDMSGGQVKQEDLGYLPDASASRRSKKQTSIASAALPKAEYSDPTLGVVLKTSFPVARIKRIMQADEDIGKVAQVTPHVVSRALELFMIKLITASSEQARGPVTGNAKGPKRVLVQHMKKAIQADEKFDFLTDIVSRVPDAPSKQKKEAASDSEDTKPKKKSKRRRDDDDDDD